MTDVAWNCNFKYDIVKIITFAVYSPECPQPADFRIASSVHDTADLRIIGTFIASPKSRPFYGISGWKPSGEQKPTLWARWVMLLQCWRSCLAPHLQWSLSRWRETWGGHPRGWPSPRPSPAYRSPPNGSSRGVTLSGDGVQTGWPLTPLSGLPTPSENILRKAGWTLGQHVAGLEHTRE